MSIFIVLAAILTLLALAWVLYPLLRPAPQDGVSSQRLNTAIYREQMEALERDFAKSNISPAEHEAARDELQLRLLDDTDVPAALPKQHTGGSLTSKRTAWAIAMVMPAGAAAMYVWLGNPAAMSPPPATPSAAQVIQMVDTLAERLKANPDNLQGWAMLARSYKVMGRLDEAEAAFVKAGDFVNKDPDLLVDYAELLALRAGNSFEGKPLALLKQALVLEPAHPNGLLISGIAAFQNNDFSGAVAQWEKLLALLQPGSPEAQQIQTNIDEARAKIGQMPPVDPATVSAMTSEKINEMVERLAQRLKSNPDDLEGWARLARAYRVQGRTTEADMADARAKGGSDLSSKPKP
jgi:cytochrome c-type biogenesis protein CcmH